VSLLRVHAFSISVDDQFAARGCQGIGAWIMGRYMFGPIRGPWTDEACQCTEHVPTAAATHIVLTRRK